MSSPAVEATKFLGFLLGISAIAVVVAIGIIWLADNYGMLVVGIIFLVILVTGAWFSVYFHERKLH